MKTCSDLKDELKDVSLMTYNIYSLRTGEIYFDETRSFQLVGAGFELSQPRTVMSGLIRVSEFVRQTFYFRKS